MQNDTQRINVRTMIDLLPPGFGPFQMVEYEKSVRVVLERNDNFFRGKPLLEKICITSGSL